MEKEVADVCCLYTNPFATGRPGRWRIDALAVTGKSHDLAGKWRDPRWFQLAISR